MDTKDLYAIVAGYNDYDQHGSYLVSVFSEKPSFETFKKVSKEYSSGIGMEYGEGEYEKIMQHYYEGKGRYHYEYHWVNLVKLKEGAIFEED